MAAVILHGRHGENHGNRHIVAALTRILLAMKTFAFQAFLVVSILLRSHFPVSAQIAAPANIPQPIFLWPNGAPGALGTAEVDKPRLYPFVPGTKSTTTAILVIPGGGYVDNAIAHEGFQFAHWLNAQGVTAFVLNYRVAPYKYPAEIQDGMRAVRYIRAHAAEYGIDANRIGVWGSSAGGHLASTIGVHGNDAAPLPEKTDDIDNTDARVNFMILSYPVISMQPPETHKGSLENLLGTTPDPQMQEKFSNQLHVNAQTPPTFLFATTKDPIVPVENSLDMYRALERAHVPVELHIYDYANHGCGLCGSIPELSTWPLLLRNWLIHSGFLPRDAPPMPPPGPNEPWPAGLQGPGMKK